MLLNQKKKDKLELEQKKSAYNEKETIKIMKKLGISDYSPVNNRPPSAETSGTLQQMKENEKRSNRVAFKYKTSFSKYDQ